VLKVVYKQAVLTSILHLKMVDRNSTVEKARSFSAAIFCMFKIMLIIQLHGHIHTKKTTSASACHVMIYIVISSFSHTSMHTHTYAYINIIFQLLSQKYLDYASQIRKTGCKATVISSVLSFTMFVSSRHQTRT